MKVVKLEKIRCGYCGKVLMRHGKDKKCDRCGAVMRRSEIKGGEK